MPAVLTLNAPAIAGRFDRAAPYLGIEGGFEGVRAFVRKFNDRLVIPRRLRDLGVRDVPMEALVDSALSDPSCGGNPVALTRENPRALFEAVI